MDKIALGAPCSQVLLSLSVGELDSKVHLMQFHLKLADVRLEIGLRPTWWDLVRLETESVSRPTSSVTVVTVVTLVTVVTVVLFI